MQHSLHHQPMASSFAQMAQSQPPPFNPFATQTKATPSVFGLDGAGDASWAKRNKRKGRSNETTDDDSKRNTFNTSSKSKDSNLSDGSKNKTKRAEDKRRKGGEQKQRTVNGNAKQKKNRSQGPRNGANVFENETSSSSSSSEDEASGAPTELADPHARKVYTRLHKDNISPPNWPSQPGAPGSKAAMAKFREQYETYRDKVRASLTKAGLIDDPDKRKTLQDAIDFKGICEDMCPEFEKIQRITENGVERLEKDPRTNNAATSRLVKKLARSAAGQEAPLPMDVRSVQTLRKTIDYLIDDVLRNDKNLPSVHQFLWDRTRAIRRDFTFFSSLTPEELKTQVYVLETIARLHVTALHLLSRKDHHTYEGFSQQQELEQLGKSLLSLRDLYDDCNEQGIVCENEAEFRAYFILHHSFDSNMIETLQRQWKPELWRDSDDLRTAVSLVEALQNTSDFHGPLKHAPWLAASAAHLSYFRIVEDPSISYTMACFAECNFPRLRRSILNSIVHALTQPKKGSQDVTAATLAKLLRFDTVDEAIEFAKFHDLEFQDDPENPLDTGRKRLILQPRTELPHKRLPHAFSQSVVEKKRGGRSLPEVLRRTVFEVTDKGGLFVTDGESGSPEAESLPKSNTFFVAKQSLQEPASPFADTTQVSTIGLPFSSQPGVATTQQSSSVFSQPTSSSLSTNSQPIQNSFSAPANPPTDPSAKTFSQPNGLSTALSSPLTAKPPERGLETTSTASSLSSFTTSKPIGATPTFSWTASSIQGPKTLGQQDTSSVTGIGENAKSQAGPVESPFKLPTANLSLGGSQNQLQPSPTATSGSTQLGTQPSASQSSPQVPKPSNSFLNERGPKLDANTILGPRLSTPAIPSFSPQAQAPSSCAVATASTSSSAPARVAESPPRSPSPPRDLFGDFVKWYVLGDNGIMEDFQAFLIDDMLKKLYDKFVAEEEEKRRLQEIKHNNEQADALRKYQLSVRYFYRWKDIAREKRLRQVRRSGRDEVKALRAQEHAEWKRQREEVKRAAEARKRASKSNRPEELKVVVEKQRLDRREVEDALLKSGVLSGIGNEKEAVANIVRSEYSRSVTGYVAASESRQSSPGHTRKGGKTQALRDSLLGTTIGFRRSLPSVSTRSTASPEPSGSRPSRVSERWRLKAMGIVQMPDGTAVPEFVARHYMPDARKYSGLTAPGLSRSTSSRRASVAGATPHTLEYLRQSSGSKGDDSQHKRKRTSEDDGAALKDGDANVNSHKRVMSDAEKLRQELRALRQEVEEETTWFKSQNVRLQSEAVSTGTTPFDESI